MRDRPIFESQLFSALWSWAKLVTSAGLIILIYKIRIFVFCGCNEYYKSVKILVWCLAYSGNSTFRNVCVNMYVYVYAHTCVCKYI